MNVEYLNKPNSIMGKLGATLGEIITVDGEFTAATLGEGKSLEGVLLLKVYSVNGEKLKEPLVLPAKWLMKPSQAKIKGSVKLIGYESGEFAGVPVAAFSYILPVASEDFHFENHFVLLKEITRGSKKTSDQDVGKK